MGTANVATANRDRRWWHVTPCDRNRRRRWRGFPDNSNVFDWAVAQSSADTNWSQESLRTYCDAGHNRASDQAPRHVDGYEGGARPVPEESPARRKHR